MKKLSQSVISRFALLAVAGLVSACSNMQEAGKSYENFEQRLIGNTMVGIGLKAPQQERIEYRPRAPLVIPPAGSASALRAPEDASSVRAANAAWPNDPDAARRRRAAEDAATPIDDLRYREARERRLTPEEMKGEGIAVHGAGNTPNPYADDRTARAVNPAELDKGWQPPSSGSSIFSDPDPENDARDRPAFGQSSNPQFDQQREAMKRERTAVDTSRLGAQEPARKTLLDPPSGYRAPAPDPNASADAANEAEQAPWYKRILGKN